MQESNKSLLTDPLPASPQRVCLGPQSFYPWTSSSSLFLSYSDPTLVWEGWSKIPHSELQASKLEYRLLRTQGSLAHVGQQLSHPALNFSPLLAHLWRRYSLWATGSPYPYPHPRVCVYPTKLNSNDTFSSILPHSSGQLVYTTLWSLWNSEFFPKLDQAPGSSLSLSHSSLYCSHSSTMRGSFISDHFPCLDFALIPTCVILKGKTLRCNGGSTGLWNSMTGLNPSCAIH